MRDTSKMASLLCAGLAMGVVALPVGIAQVVTPPPATVTPIDWNIPKAPPAPPPPPVSAEAAVTQAQPAARPQAPIPRLPELPYQALAQKGSDGKIQPLTEPLQLAALRRNPMMPANFVDSIKDVLNERNELAATLVVANLDIMERIEDGIFESVDFNNKATIRTCMETVRPLTKAMKPLGEDLRGRGLMDQMQTRFSGKIAHEFLRAINDERFAAEGSDKSLQSTALLMALYKQNVEDSVFTYEMALRTVLPDFEQALSSVEADDAAKAKAREIASKASQATTGAERQATLKGLRDVFTIDQRRQFVAKAIDLWNARGRNAM